MQPDIRQNWTAEEVEKILTSPLTELMYQAQTVHRANHAENTVQLAALLSIKTGACPEDCAYCPQSAHYAKKVGLPKEPLMEVEDVLAKAKVARDNGATRFCMGAAWRHVRDGEQFDRVLKMVEGVKHMGMEACVTLGMLNQDQANRLKQAGLTAYNHNLDCSPEFYPKIISTRSYQERLDTLECVQKAGISVCCGGIVGMGETIHDRARLLQILANMTPQPESVPINALVAVDGTPLEDQPELDPMEMVRMIATARILMPKARVRLSAGRKSLTREAQILCLMAGANSIFYGEKLLTTANNDVGDDLAMIAEAGLKVEALAP